MTKKKLSAAVVENNIAQEEKEVSVITQIRQIVIGKRIATAKQEFIDLALKVDKDFTEEKFEQRKEALKNFTIVFTRPSDAGHAKGLTEVHHDWNKVLQFGRKWFYKTQEISDCLSVARSYYSYDTYLLDKENALKREAKKLVESMSKEELIKLLQANKQQ